MVYSFDSNTTVAVYTLLLETILTSDLLLFSRFSNQNQGYVPHTGRKSTGFFAGADGADRPRRGTRRTLSAQRSAGRRPLHLAVQFGHSNMVQQLLKAKADVQAKDDTGESWVRCARTNASQMARSSWRTNIDRRSKGFDQAPPRSGGLFSNMKFIKGTNFALAC